MVAPVGLAAGHRSKHSRLACRAADARHGKRHRKHKRRCKAHATRHAHAKRKAQSAETATVLTLAPSPAATIAGVLASACQNTGLTPEAGNLEAVETATLCLINQERARNNELPLQPNSQLAQAARRHTQSMLGESYFAHIAPDGETPLDRVQAGGYIPNPTVGYTIGENLAWGTLYLATPNSIVAAWIASPEHLANILTAEYRDTAIVIAPAAPASLADGQPGALYTEEFGVIAAS